MSQVFIVMLRCPEANDARTDPFWEFGSFGCTGCHSNNLLHPKNCRIKDGDRVAFVQGGPLGTRMLLLTPPVKRIDHCNGGVVVRVELRWSKKVLPFRYQNAPGLFDSPSPGRPGKFPVLTKSLNDVNRSTAAARLASRYRAKAEPLDDLIAGEVLRVFKAAQQAANKNAFIKEYHDALPHCDCPTVPKEREREYDELLRGLASKVKTRCRTQAKQCRKNQ